MSTEAEVLIPADDAESSSALQVIGWFSVGMAVAALGIVVGRELRNRYKFSHRTPYDFYSNAGQNPTSEFGMGI
ncbi:MAG TPA: hypothetical protein VND90_04435 [Terracidiphilus sp.]|nr:hypothetical protein [Terracidiphilus sp.]